ncbi:Uncharacterized protein TCM_024637 [Theobroma cacao]|uniref:Uncharacterized protein n=1 Tax=Theobroma cacao TaxID=3641 RepID=A0A061F404_THECC|nr:Uncharacterized protein TCM_024637 [Theobroma cacao]
MCFREPFLTRFQLDSLNLELTSCAPAVFQFLVGDELALDSGGGCKGCHSTHSNLSFLCPSEVTFSPRKEINGEQNLKSSLLLQSRGPQKSLSPGLVVKEFPSALTLRILLCIPRGRGHGFLTLGALMFEEQLVESWLVLLDWLRSVRRKLKFDNKSKVKRRLEVWPVVGHKYIWRKQRRVTGPHPLRTDLWASALGVNENNDHFSLLETY